MADDKQLLDCISETADMACSSLRHVMALTRDEQLKRALQVQLTEYERDYSAADGLSQQGGKPKRTPLAPKLYANLMANVKTMTAENADSRIAEMVIQGSTMGITVLTQHLNGYSGNNAAVRTLAQQHIQKEQANIEEMKRFL